MKYNILYVDPPWPNKGSEKGMGKAESHYNLMQINEILNLPIRKICDDNCALFLWSPMIFLPLAFDVIKTWGFKYRTCAFTWVKLNPKLKTPCIGLGNYTRSNAELCLLGIKGKLRRESKKVSQIVMANRGFHSRKPSEVRDRIVELFGDIPRAELFARTAHQGWDSWGNELSPEDYTPIFAQ